MIQEGNLPIQPPKHGLALLVLALLVFCWPRFNQQDWLVGRWTGTVWDAQEYVAMVHYLRSSDDARAAVQSGQQAKPLTAPFCYRPLVPWLASCLPLDPLTAINIINVVALMIAALALYQLQRRLEIGPRASTIGACLLIASFPTFYYGAIGLVDPVLICCITLALQALLCGRLYRCCGYFLAGVLVKESIIILLPVIGAHLALQPRRSRFRMLSLAAGLISGYILLSLLARNLFPADSPAYVWSPSWSRWVGNAVRTKTWLSLLLSLGVPGLLAIWGASQWRARWFIARRREVVPLAAGMAASFALFGYAMVSAYADGRFIWLAHPFAIPLAMIAIQSRRKQLRRKNLPPPHFWIERRRRRLMAPSTGRHPLR